jgi:hypothetical protein
VIGTSVIVGLVLVAVAVAYGVYLRHVSPGQPALAPAQTAADKAEAQAVLAKAKELYDNYKPGAGADPYAQLETAGLITPTLHIIMNNHKAPYDQVLCAQNQPERFNYNEPVMYHGPSSAQDTDSKNWPIKDASMQVTEVFSSYSQTTVRLVLVKDGGAWKINQITCPESQGQ